MKIEMPANEDVLIRTDKNNPFSFGSERIPEWSRRLKVGDMVAFWDLPSFKIVYYPIKSITQKRYRAFDHVFDHPYYEDKPKKREPSEKALLTTGLLESINLCPENYILKYSGETIRVKNLKFGDELVLPPTGHYESIEQDFSKPEQNSKRLEFYRYYMKRGRAFLAQIREWKDKTKAPFGYSNVEHDIYVLEFENVQPNHWGIISGFLMRGDE